MRPTVQRKNLASGHASLSEAHASVQIPSRQRGLFRRMFAVAGPAYLVAVGYMDPGNWATDLAAGSSYNYALLWVLLASNLMAVLLQSLSARLGIARGLDLAQACRDEYSRPVNLSLYGLCELAITACDLAEVLGSAIALQLLFGLPLVWGVLITAADTFLLLFLSHFGIRKLEAVILMLITVIAGALLFEVFLARPDWRGVLTGLAPSMPDYGALIIALGMLGATVMPHNLYLHSSLVQTRRLGDSPEARREAVKLNTIDSAIALNLAFFVNAAILVMAAAVFYRAGLREVADLQDAHHLLEGLVGSALAPIAFGVALLASGQSSTITGTLAGQIVMEGFLAVRIPPWVRRLVTRLAAIIPAVTVILVFGEGGTGMLLVLSQVVLSLQLPFAAIPLLQFVSDREKMGELAIGPVVRVLGWLTVSLIVGLNVWLVYDTLRHWSAALGPNGVWLTVALSPLLVGAGLLLAYVVLKPVLSRLQRPRLAPVPHIHGAATPLPVGSAAAGEPLLAAAAARPQERVAIALDFEGREREVLGATVRLLGPRRPRLALFHVAESAATRYAGREAADAEVLDDAARLEAYAAELRALGFEVEARLGVGKRVPELARLVNEFGADLLVVGAHGHRFLSDLVRGSTVDALRHRVDCDVFLVGKGTRV